MFCYNSSQNKTFAHPPMAYEEKNLNKAIYVASHIIYNFLSFFCVRSAFHHIKKYCYLRKMICHWMRKLLFLMVLFNVYGGEKTTT